MHDLGEPVSWEHKHDAVTTSERSFMCLVHFMCKPFVYKEAKNFWVLPVGKG